MRTSAEKPRKTAKAKSAKVKTAKVKTAKAGTVVVEGRGAGGSKSTPKVIKCLPRSGESKWQGAKVLRVFVLAGRKANDGAFVAKIVKEALGEAQDRDYKAILLPAGIGAFAQPFTVDANKKVKRSEVEKAAKDWVTAYRAEFGLLTCPVVLGVDGGGVSANGKKNQYELQTALAFDQTKLSVTFKSLPANSGERTWLVAPNDGKFGRLTKIGSRRAALQVCHDGVVRFARGEAASTEDGVSGRMRAAMLPELEREGLWIFNVIHQLPRAKTSRSATSPAFQASHRVLCNNSKNVIAVSGVPRGARQADHFAQLSERLACVCLSDDVLIDAG